MQRNGIYAERKRILERDNLRDWIFEYAERSLYDLVLFIEQKSYDSEVTSSVLQKLQNLLGIPFKLEYSLLDKDDLNNLVSSLHQQFRISYDLKEAELEMLDSGLMRELERSFLLQQIDFSWREHLQKISFLRESIGWRAYGQKDPLTEYKREAYNFFVLMLTRIRQRVVYFILRSKVVIEM